MLSHLGTSAVWQVASGDDRWRIHDCLCHGFCNEQHHDRDTLRCITSKPSAWISSRVTTLHRQRKQCHHRASPSMHARMSLTAPKGACTPR
jgi:hypothetical protein